MSGAVPDQAATLADAPVTARKKDADTARAELRELVAQLLCICRRKVVLVAAVRYGDCLRDPRLLKHILEPHNIWVRVRLRVRVRNPAYAVEYVRGRVRYGLGQLDVEVGLDARLVRVVLTVVDRLDGKLRVFHVGAVFLHEIQQILRARVLLAKARNTERVPVHRVW